METSVRWEGGKTILFVNNTLVNWTDTTTKSPASFDFQMSDVFQDQPEVQSGLDEEKEEMDFLREGQSRYYSTVIVLILAGLFFGFTVTVTIAVGIFCRKRNSVFVFQKAEQEDGTYEMRGNNTDEEYEDEVEPETFWRKGRTENDKHRAENGKVMTGPIASEPLFQTVDLCDNRHQPRLHHNSLENLEKERLGNKKHKTDHLHIYRIPNRSQVVEPSTEDFKGNPVFRDTRQFFSEHQLLSGSQNDSPSQEATTSLQSSLDSSDNTVIEVTNFGGRLFLTALDKVKSPRSDEDKYDEVTMCSSNDEVSADEVLSDSDFVCEDVASTETAEISVLLPDKRCALQRPRRL